MEILKIPESCRSDLLFLLQEEAKLQELSDPVEQKGQAKFNDLVRQRLAIKIAEYYDEPRFAGTQAIKRAEEIFNNVFEEVI